MWPPPLSVIVKPPAPSYTTWNVVPPTVTVCVSAVPRVKSAPPIVSTSLSPSRMPPTANVRLLIAVSSRSLRSTAPSVMLTGVPFSV